MGSQEIPVKPDQLTTTNLEQPWLCDRGFKIPDDQLKVISKSWGERTWERYLEWFETPRAESLLDPHDYDEAVERMSENFFVHAQNNASQDLAERVGLSLSRLTARQRKVLAFLFWHGLSLRKIGAILKISHVSVIELRNRALKKLAHADEQPPTSSRIMGGQINFLPEKGVKHDEEVLVLAQPTIHQT